MTAIPFQESPVAQSFNLFITNMLRRQRIILEIAMRSATVWLTMQ
jgi:hypothetical protein